MPCWSVKALSCIVCVLTLSGCLTDVSPDGIVLSESVTLASWGTNCPPSREKWTSRGFYTGRGGDRIDREYIVQTYTKPCAKKELPIDYEAYLRGAIAGRREYCTPAGAYWVGRDALPKSFEPALCPDMTAEEVAEAKAANKAGRRARRYKREIDRVYARGASFGGPANFYYDLSKKDREEVDMWQERLDDLPKYPKQVNPSF